MDAVMQNKSQTSYIKMIFDEWEFLSERQVYQDKLIRILNHIIDL
jgi:regulator of sirC expression with transglutaminase-like and TPR domain